MPDGYDIEHIQEWEADMRYDPRKGYVVDDLKPKCIIVDLEGTLTDCSHRFHHWQNKDYDRWNALFHLDTPNRDLIDYLYARYKTEKIILCTAKDHSHKDEVNAWLKQHNLDFFDDWLYRSGADKRPSVEVKRDMVDYLLKHYDIVHAFDDRLDIIHMYTNFGIKTTLIDCRTTHTSPSKRAPEILEECAQIHRERNKVYGDSYLEFGKIMLALFPEGLELKTESDFTRFAIYNWKMSKVHRYAKNFSKGGHKDSLDDLAVYSAMLQEVDNEGDG